jgi:prevent-host-death family protein
MQVNILEAKTHLSSLIKAARDGEDVVIAHRGEPMVRLVPVEGADARPSTGGALLQWLRENPLPVHMRRSSEDIEADIAAERDSWE